MDALSVEVSNINTARTSAGSDELVHQVLKHFLATGVEGRLAVGEGVLADFLEGDLFAADLRTDAGGPALVAVVNEVLEASVLADCSSDFQAACESVHAADVGVEKVGWLVGFAAALRIEVQAAGGESTHFENFQHDLGAEIDVGRELVGVPADEFVALVRIHGAERVRIDGNGHFVKHRVTGEGGVVGFQIQFEMIHEIILAEEIEARGGVGIVLVRGRFTWLWLDVELSGEADFFRVVHGEVEKVREVIEFALHVGIEESRVTFAATPEGVAFAAELERAVHRGFHLCRPVGENISVRRGAGTMCEARMCEQTCGAPEEFFASGFLEIEEVVGNLFESRVGFCEVTEFGGDVAVVPAVIIDAGLIEKLEEYVGAFEGVIDGVSAIVPRHQGSRSAKGIGEAVAHHVPVCGGEAGMVLHGFPGDDLVGIVLLERKRIFRFRAFVLDFWDIGKKRHAMGLFGVKGGGKCENDEIKRWELIQAAGNHTNGAVSRPVDAVIDFLKSEKAKGKHHVYLDEEARLGLRELFIRSKEPVKTQAEAAVIPAREPAAAAPVSEVVIEGADKAAKLQSIRLQAAKWSPAVSLGSLRETMVFATGDPDARIMLIGEAPGYNEEKEEKPFVGPAGKKLNDILKAMGISREQVYISNLVKFRPALPKQTTNNRKPTPEEMAACLPLVIAEISVVKPELILALGGTAAEGLLGLEGTVGGMRGTWHELSGIPTRVTYHPSYLLQSGGSNQVKRSLWEDMLAAMEKLGMPISEKQRGFFLPKKS